jgi:hypothetical protein
MEAKTPISFQGQTLSEQDLADIKEITDTCRGLSRTELASTICELFSWARPSGKLKTVECWQFLEYLEADGLIGLPPQRRRINSNPMQISPTARTDSLPAISCDLDSLPSFSLMKVTTRAERLLWYEYVDRYHYLGYRRPFGAHLRYFVQAGSPATYLGCLQFSSPAWKMAPRDKWVGWDDEQRIRNLQKIICNSRFLILPWIQVKNLASCVLSLALKQVADDWDSMYGIRPVLVETLVDRQHKGTCYKAANWIKLGTTTGRGRMDCENKGPKLSFKDIYVYPLTTRFRSGLLM